MLEQGSEGHNFLEQEAGALARASRAQEMSRNVGQLRRWRGTERRPYRTWVERAVLSPKSLEQNGDGRPLWESLWPSLGALEVIRVRVTPKKFNDAKKHGGHAVLFILLQNMRRETDPI